MCAFGGTREEAAARALHCSGHAQQFVPSRDGLVALLGLLRGRRELVEQVERLTRRQRIDVELAQPSDDPCGRGAVPTVDAAGAARISAR